MALTHHPKIFICISATIVVAIAFGIGAYVFHEKEETINASLPIELVEARNSEDCNCGITTNSYVYRNYTYDCKPTGASNLPDCSMYGDAQVGTYLCMSNSQCQNVICENPGVYDTLTSGVCEGDTLRYWHATEYLDSTNSVSCWCNDHNATEYCTLTVDNIEYYQTTAKNPLFKKTFNTYDQIVSGIYYCFGNDTDTFIDYGNSDDMAHFWSNGYWKCMIGPSGDAHFLFGFFTGISIFIGVVAIVCGVITIRDSRYSQYSEIK